MKKIDELGCNKQKLHPEKESDYGLTQAELDALPRIGEIAREMKALNAQIRQYLEEHPYVSK